MQINIGVNELTVDIVLYSQSETISLTYNIK